MSRHDDTLTPAMEADLAALDAALSGAPDADPAWTTLVADVRAQEPVLRPAFRGELARDVAAGFGRGDAGGAAARSRGGRLGALLRRGALPVVAVAGCLGIGAVVVTSGGPDGGTDAGGGAMGGAAESAVGAPGAGGDAGGGEAQDAGDAAGGSASSAVPSYAEPPSTGPSQVGPLGGPRRVESSTSLTLTTPPDELQDVVDGVVRETKAAGGVVASSQVISAGDGGSAQFTLRVPNARADAVVARLSALGGVSALSESTQDVTGSFVSVQDRLEDLRDERASLLRAAGRADSADEADAFQRRLRRVRGRIARAEGDLRSLRRRTTSSQIDVSVETRERGGGGLGAWTPGDAARDALRVLEVGAGVALVVAAVLAPLAALAALGAGVRRLRRRRRESALRPA